MKKLTSCFVVIIALAFLSGCAVVGGLAGGALGGNELAKKGFLLGAAVDAAKIVRDNDLKKRRNEVDQQIGSGDSVSKNSTDIHQQSVKTRATANLAGARDAEKDCQMENAVYAGGGVNTADDCNVTFHDEFQRRREITAREGPSYSGNGYGGCVGSWLRANSISPHHSKIELWRERARSACQQGWPNNGNRYSRYRQ